MLSAQQNDKMHVPDALSSNAGFAEGEKIKRRLMALAWIPAFGPNPSRRTFSEMCAEAISFRRKR